LSCADRMVRNPVLPPALLSRCPGAPGVLQSRQATGAGPGSCGGRWTRSPPISLRSTGPGRVGFQPAERRLRPDALRLPAARRRDRPGGVPVARRADRRVGRDSRLAAGADGRRDRQQSRASREPASFAPRFVRRCATASLAWARCARGSGARVRPPAYRP
jgi:hypothetical protein